MTTRLPFMSPHESAHADAPAQGAAAAQALATDQADSQGTAPTHAPCAGAQPCAASHSAANHNAAASQGRPGGPGKQQHRLHHPPNGQPQHTDDLTDPRRPYTITAATFTAVACLANAALAHDPVSATSASLMGCSTLVLLFLLLTRRLSLERVALLGLSLGTLHLFAVTWADGGLYSLKSHWLLVLLVCHFFLLKPRHSWLWGGLMVLWVLAQAVLSALWPPPWPRVEGRDALVMDAVDLLAPMILVILVIQVFRGQYVLALQQIDKHRQQLQDKQIELENTSQMRTQFIDSVSHELRTPMNIILGLNAVLLDRVHDRPQAQQVLQYTRQSASHLLTVINDVLDYSQWSSGQIATRIERFNLRETVQTAFDLFKPRLEAGDLGYVCEIADDVPHWVDGDRHRLTQVLVNLLGNAVKFTTDGLVSLRVRYSAAGVEFVVQDTGIGIAPEKQKHIFERFRQADPSIQAVFGGNGLGLPISQRLVSILGGELQLHSQVGVGTTFRFGLPLHAQPEPEHLAHVAQPRPDGAPSQRRFLIVDDHPVNRMLVRQVLKRCWPQAQVLEAQDGAVAMALLNEGPAFDLVLMDLVMPVMDGIETVTAMRVSGNAEIRQTPALGLTANVTVSELRRFEAAGLQGLLLKPFEVEHLRAAIERVLYPSAIQALQAQTR